MMGLFGTRTLDVLTMGRIGVDIYPLDQGVGLEKVKTFGKFLGGSPTNVAVAAARLSNTAAMITAVGDDPFGRYCRQEMTRLGVYDNFVVTVLRLNTPVTFCELFPPDSFPLYFYRRPTAPDLQLTLADLPMDAINNAAVLWLTATGLCQEPSRSTHQTALKIRDRKQHTILDLDYRDSFWANEQEARTAVQNVLPWVTTVIGNREECRVAIGESDPDKAAEALLAFGVDIAVVKGGPEETLLLTKDVRIEVAGAQIKVVNGLGAGDAFGGAFCHGLLRGWSLAETLVAASAAGALVATRLECSEAMPTEPELLAMVRSHDELKPKETPR